jgi:hypothetical protein
VRVVVTVVVAVVVVVVVVVSHGSGARASRRTLGRCPAATIARRRRRTFGSSATAFAPRSVRLAASAEQPGFAAPTMHWYGAAEPHCWYESQTSLGHARPAQVFVSSLGDASAHASILHDVLQLAAFHGSALQPMSGPCVSTQRYGEMSVLQPPLSHSTNEQSRVAFGPLAPSGTSSAGAPSERALAAPTAATVPTNRSETASTARTRFEPRGLTCSSSLSWRLE